MLGSLDALRDTRREWRINRSRLIVALLGVGLLCPSWFTDTTHADYPTRGFPHAIRSKPHQSRVIPPTRGQILDRKGRVLAANKSTFFWALCASEARIPKRCSRFWSSVCR